MGKSISKIHPQKSFNTLFNMDSENTHIYDILNIGVIIVNRYNVIKYTNIECLEIFGYEHISELLHKNFKDTILIKLNQNSRKKILSKLHIYFNCTQNLRSKSNVLYMDGRVGFIKYTNINNNVIMSFYF